MLGLCLATSTADASGPDFLFRAIESLGVPIVFATVLLWFFLRSNKALASQNEKLIDEVAVLRQQVDTTVHALDVNERLMTQNERLVESVRSKEEAFVEVWKLVANRSANIDSVGADGESSHD